LETLLPLSSIASAPAGPGSAAQPAGGRRSIYEFVPSPESILEEVIPASFKVKLFKCFLDSAVSEQIARMVAMKSATENADDLIRRLSMEYNRARQSRITSELMDVIGGVEALS
jgi:F-type H+-transporting ATPase subunit gamma